MAAHTISITGLSGLQNLACKLYSVHTYCLWSQLFYLAFNSATTVLIWFPISDKI